MFMKRYTISLALILAGCGAESTPDSSELEAEGKSTQRKNLLVNAEFSETIDNWQPGWPTEWNGYHGARATGSAKVTASSILSSKGRVAFDQCVNLPGLKQFEAGISYTIGAGSSQSGGGRFRITWFDETDCAGKNATGSIHADIDETAGSGWHQLELRNLEAPESAKSAGITVIQTISGAGDFIVYWDDAYFSASE